MNIRTKAQQFVTHFFSTKGSIKQVEFKGPEKNYLSVNTMITDDKAYGKLLLPIKINIFSLEAQIGLN